MEQEGEGEGAPNVAARHINKRALKNKALSISFNDKDLRDYVTGFHKRKKKRRKEAQRQLQEKDRLKRIEARKKRKLEKELALYGGALPVENPSGTISGPEERASDHEEDDGLEPNPSVSGTKIYDTGDTTIMVTTSEISREDDDLKATNVFPMLSGLEKRQHSLPVKKKPFKRAVKQKSQKKPKKSTSQKKGGNKKGRNNR
eukprot:TRINITY_DN58897_c0_g1_i1.p1 TRINITY_DN58897_c0_g1~~TRINITY_DN58897_c0_g1_i1.p1  ORF type:complete len:202 (+),score=45.58 TRINITY_DN58897_c0_g1_i1:99-704(+)